MLAVASHSRHCSSSAAPPCRPRRMSRRRARASARLILLALLVSAFAAAPAEARTIEAFIGSNLVNVQGHPPHTDVTVEVLRGGVVVGSRTMTTDADGFLEINHVGDADCFDPPATPDVTPGDVIRTTTAGDDPGVTDQATLRDLAIDFEAITTRRPTPSPSPGTRSAGTMRRSRRAPTSSS